MEHMDYRQAEQQYQTVLDKSSNSLMQLRADVGMMSVCQILSRNKDYYAYREDAYRQIKALGNPEQSTDSAYLSAIREMKFTEAVYLYNMREIAESRVILKEIGMGAVSSTELLSQYLGRNTLYMRSLNACAHAGELTSEKLYDQALDSLAYALSLVNAYDRVANGTSQSESDTLMLYCADDSEGASVEMNWIADESRLVIPEWLAAIRDQLSITFGAMGMKAESDYNHNVYLDILDATRLDRQAEQRLDAFTAKTHRMTLMLYVVGGAIILLLLVFAVALYFQRHSHRWQEAYDECEELRQAYMMKGESDKRNFLQRLAAVDIANGIKPFLDRAVREADRLEQTHDSSYLSELMEKISLHNDILGHWVKINRGNVGLTIENFDIQPLMQTVAKAAPVFASEGITLNVQDVSIPVKADRALTLFMINTLVDNARKFTPRGGSVSVSAESNPQEHYVEIAVTDTGCGIAENDTRDIVTQHKGHGFGLVNCRGIIEQYRKQNRQFGVCTFDVQSEEGKGSRFSFRIPLVVRRAAMSLLLLLCMAIQPSSAQSLTSCLDSMCVCNISGRYAETVEWGRKALNVINQRIATETGAPSTVLTIIEETDIVPEVELWRMGQSLDYDTLLMVRNELAIAALSLNRRVLYRYNTTAMTKLYRLMSEDPDIDRQCARQLDRCAVLRVWLYILLAVFFIVLSAGIRLWFRQYRRMADIMERKQDEMRRADMESGRIHVQNMLLDNCLSTIKHETMYYPSRILNLLRQGTQAEVDILAETRQLVNYYHEIFTLFMERAVRQTQKPPFRRQRINAAQLLASVCPEAQIQGDPSVSIVGDASMLDIMIRTLTKSEKEIRINFAVQGKFCTFALTNPQWHWTAEQIHSLFYADSMEYDPSSDTLLGSEFYLAREVIRLHDEHAGLRGCGIRAEGSDTLVWTLPSNK